MQPERRGVLFVQDSDHHMYFDNAPEFQEKVLEAAAFET